MDIYIYIYNLLHREQLYVSALDNGRLQVPYETLIKKLYKTYIYIYIWDIYKGQGGGKVGTRFRICPKGWMVWVAWRTRAFTKLCLKLL